MSDSGNPEETNKPYEVGHGKPPKHTRFKKGKSGNPKGRPKGSCNYSTDVKEALKTRVRLTVNGKPKTMSRQQASIEMLIQKAFAGNERFLIKVQEMAAMHNDDEVAEIDTQSMPKKDTAIIKQYLASQPLPSSEKGGNDAPDN